MGNTRVRPAIYNPSNGTYTAAPLATSTGNASSLKSKHLPATPPGVADVDMLDDADELDPESTTTQKLTLDEDRTFTVRKWALVPAAIADKRAEPKYLADRRPGLGSLYGQTVSVAAPYVPAPANVGLGFSYTNAAGETMSSTGLPLENASALGISNGAAAATNEAPRRRGPPPPPKRKKKGGLGRRKKVQIAAPSSNQIIIGMDGAMDTEKTGTNTDTDVKTEEGAEGLKDDDDDDGSGSEGEEGSEEGEIDEGNGPPVPTETSESMANVTEASDTMVPEFVVTQAEDVPRNEEVLHVQNIPQDTEASPAQVSDIITAPTTDAESTTEITQDTIMTVHDVTSPVHKDPPTATEQLGDENLDAEDITTNTTTPPVPEIDLLGSLDLAVQDMEGANAAEEREG